MDLKVGSMEGMNCFHLGRWGQVADCHEHANEPALKDGELTNLRTVHFKRGFSSL
jgi:hypothetical protein